MKPGARESTRGSYGRWLTFSEFWGAAFYAMDVASVALTRTGKRRFQRMDPRSVGLGLALNQAVHYAGIVAPTGWLISRRRHMVPAKQMRKTIEWKGPKQRMRAMAWQGAAMTPGAMALSLSALWLAGRILGRNPAPGVRKRDLLPAFALSTALRGLSSYAAERIFEYEREDLEESLALQGRLKAFPIPRHKEIKRRRAH